MADTTLTVEALDFHVTTSKGLGDLAVLLAELLENELTLESVIILSTSAVLTTLS